MWRSGSKHGAALLFLTASSLSVSCVLRALASRSLWWKRGVGGAGSEAGSCDEAGQAAYCRGPWLDFKPQPQVESKTIPIPSLLSKSLRQGLGHER